MASVPAHVYSVVDTTNNEPLESADITDLEKQNPALDATGNPYHYYLQGLKTIRLYPDTTVDIRVRYAPEAADLVDTDPATVFPFPKQHHLAVVWAGMKYLLLNEDRFRDNAQLDRAIKK